jgi:hypothetical protein
MGVDGLLQTPHVFCHAVNRQLIGLHFLTL